jgi:hypothetical protein
LKMRIIIFMLTLLVCTSVSKAQKKPSDNQSGKRIEKIINSQWTFNYFPNVATDKGYESYIFDDSKWPAISLPHTWNTYETTGEINHLQGNTEESDNTYWTIGWGWYRKHFLINPDLSSGKVFVEFHGVQNYCKVWLNGKLLGDHKGGYGSFDFDITQYIKPGQDNVLAVAVNIRQKDALNLTADEVNNSIVYGGICGDVTLAIKDKLYIPMQGSATHEGGTFITTPGIEENEGVVRIQTWVKNDDVQKKICTLQTSVSDASNKIIQVIRSEAEIAPGQLFKFDQTSDPVKNPHLWSVEDPYLYKIYSEVVDSKEIVDTYSCTFGFRWYRWNFNDRQLSLNGNKQIKNYGNWYQEYPWLGDAIPKWITVLDYLDMSAKKTYNLMNISNYQNSKLVAELADKYGMVISEESRFNEKGIFSVEEHEQAIKEMVRRDRNHPSIMMWSMGNETKQDIDSKVARAEDTTRIIIGYSVSDTLRRTFNKLPGKEQQSVSSRLVTTGEPARITLTGSHQKITADRGSVAIVTAGIVDLQGNQVYGASKTIKWVVTGPALLIGPSYFESAINKNNRLKGILYPDLPVSNIIRSTGKPGKIRITVSASGLASGSLDIESEELLTDKSAFIEPVLDDRGRKSVERITPEINRTDEIPREIKLSSDDFSMVSSYKKEYALSIRDYIIKNNTSPDTSSIELKTLVDLFASLLFNNNGRLTAYDYNFNIDNYNNCRLIVGYVNSTKLPQLFKEGLKKYYAGLIIWQGSEIIAGDEMNWLNWIPSGGTVIISDTGGTVTVIKGAIVTGKSELADLIAVVHPGFLNFSDEGKERALVFISKMNPYIHVTRNTGGDKEKMTQFSYIAERGQPILIPLLKFIAE